MALKEIIAVTNDKGGVGKTTTAQNLAMGLKLKGYSVLVIDADSQRYASFLNGWDSVSQQGRTLFEAMSNPSPLPVYLSEKGIYYTPSSKKMASIDPYLKDQLSPNTILKEVFEMPIEKHFEDSNLTTIADFDYVIIDCPPSLGSTTINAMAAATGLIIPAQLEAFSIRGLGEVTAKFKDVQRSLNQDLKIRGFLLVMADDRLVSAKVYTQQLREAFNEAVFNTRIRRNVYISEAQDSDGDIFSYDAKSKGAQDYMAFTEEFLSRNPKF